MVGGGGAGRSALGSAMVSFTSLPAQALSDKEKAAKISSQTLAKKSARKEDGFLGGEFMGGQDK
jgi:hypothetical protein